MARRSDVQLSDGGPVVPADILVKTGIIAIHRPPDGGKGWILTHVPSGCVVIRCKTKGDAAKARRRLEAMPDPTAEEAQEAVREFRY